MPVSFGTIGGTRIRFADSGGPQQPVIVLTSSWPESVYAFRPMWDTLSAHGILLGRTAFEMFEPAWSSRTKYVVSGTLDKTTGGG